MRDLRSLFVSAALAAASAGTASAQSSYYGYHREPQHDPLDPAGFSMYVSESFDGAGFASPSEVRSIVGDVRFALTCSEPRGEVIDLERDREVRAYLPAGPERLPDRTVVNTIVGAALNKAFKECPVYWHNVNRVEIYGPSSDLLLRASNYTGMFHKWREFTDVRAEREADAARQRQFEAQQAAKAQREAARQRALAERRAAGERAVVTFWSWVQIAALGAALLFIWSKREGIAYWYHSLTPHPATDMVHRAVNGHGDIDGELFANVMREMPGSRAEKRARADQAERLAAMARAAAARRTEQLKRERDRAVQDAAFIRAQDELRQAAEEHELAKARLDALRKWKDRHVR